MPPANPRRRTTEAFERALPIMAESLRDQLLKSGLVKEIHEEKRKSAPPRQGGNTAGSGQPYAGNRPKQGGKPQGGGRPQNGGGPNQGRGPSPQGGQAW